MYRLQAVAADAERHLPPRVNAGARVRGAQLGRIHFGLENHRGAFSHFISFCPFVGTERPVGVSGMELHFLFLFVFF